MTNKNTKTRVRRTDLSRTVLGGAIALALTAWIAPAQAWDFSSGDWKGNIDTTVSYGVSMRLGGQDSNLIGKSQFNPATFTLTIPNQIAQRGRFSVNGDDGDLNYKKHDLFSNAFKITSE